MSENQNLSVLEARLSGIEHLLEILVSQKLEADQLPSKPLTIQQAADYVCKAIPTVYAMVSRREIPHYKRGKKLYFNATELSEWLEDGRRPTTKALLEESKTSMRKIYVKQTTSSK